MENINRILFPVDFSESTTSIIPHVKKFVGAFKAELHVLYVLRDIDHLANLHVPYPDIQEFQQHTQEGAEQRLHEFCNQTLPAFSALQCATTTGDIAREIINLCGGKNPLI